MICVCAGLPAVQQTLKIVSRADAQMRIDAALSGRDAEPNQLRAVDVDGPIEPVRRRPEPVVRPGRQFAIGHRLADRIQDRLIPFVEHRVGAVAVHAIVAAAVEAANKHSIFRDRDVVADRRGELDKELAALRALHRHPLHQRELTLGDRQRRGVAGIGQAPVAFPIRQQLDREARVAFALEQIGGAAVDRAPVVAQAFAGLHQHAVGRVLRPGLALRQQREERLGIVRAAAPDVPIAHV